MHRPTSVTVFGILNIGFAVLGILGIVVSIVMFATMNPSQNPVIKIMHGNPSYAAWMKLSLPFGLVAVLAELVSGIGLLLMKPWARKLAVGYAIFAIAFGALGTVVNFFLLMRPMLEEAMRKRGPEAVAAMGGTVGGTIGGCIGLIYPILILIFMTRPKVVAAFYPQAAPPVIPL